ncbi:MAG: WbqC family protein [Candidatus Aminicenantes bacterium]|nr:WbqC family protein [Candidatus Aminicenantes bacterium]
MIKKEIPTMRISFSQPVFIPWGGFYGRLLNSDLMIILDSTLFARGFTFVNRNRLKAPQGEIWVTVPVRKKGLGRQRTRDLRIFQPENWARKFLALLKHYYGHSFYFEQTIGELEKIISSAGENFLDLTQGCARFLADSFRINTGFSLQSELGVENRGTDLLVELALRVGAKEVILPYLADRHLNLDSLSRNGIKVFFLKYQPVAYPQFWGDFIANLSALDLWLCCGPDGLKNIGKSSRVTVA